MTVEATTYENEAFVEHVDPSPTYDFLFESIGADAVEVYEVLDDTTRVRVSADDFTVTFGGFGATFDGGQVIFLRAHPGDLFQVSIERNTPITQNVDFSAYKDFPASQIEYSLDKQIMIMQEIAFRKCDNKDP